MSDETPEFEILTLADLQKRAEKDREFRRQMFVLIGDTRRLPEKWTWRDLVKIEPRLVELENDARELAKSEVPYSLTGAFYGGFTFREVGFKVRLSDLAGSQSAHPALRSSKVYDFVYRRIYRILEKGENAQ